MLEMPPQEHKLADPSMTWGACSDRGLCRQANEDAFFIVPELGLFLVSDGMGGHQGGALASRIVAEDLPVMIEANLHTSRSSDPRIVRRIFSRAIAEQSKQLRLEGTFGSGYREMGATLVLLMIQNGRAYVGNLGDSRVYRLRKGSFLQISRDHSVVAQLIEQGHIAPCEAENHEAQGQITHYVGMEEEAKPHIRSFQCKPKDRFLLCTDGLTDMLDNKAIEAILRESKAPQETADRLVAGANEAGGHDNITVIVVDYKLK
ncbi:MAG: serine/threonine-protein phosphatase [Sedimentisphaerales bacterium]|nr:serine/threonine-protein phosphatase [Sedimentisphaerales bacterium]